MKFSLIRRLNITLAVCAAAVIFAPQSIMAAPSTLVIDEFQVFSADPHDEYVVIANYGDAAVNLDGYSLIKRATSTTNYKLFDAFGSFVLNSKERIVVAHLEYTGARDFTFSANTIADNNAMYLLAPDKSVVDLVGYGDAVYYEGAPVPAPAAGEIYARVSGKDTDNNSKDFVLKNPPKPIDPNAARIVFSELYPNPAEGGEWFELYNPTNHDILLTNLKVCDALGTRHCFRFAVDDALLAGEYKIYEQAQTKITLNNSGDWLELYDEGDNLLADSGENYGDADKGFSLALFGSRYLWTQTPTPGKVNIFTDILEQEVDTPKPKTSTAKPKKVAKAATTQQKRSTVTEATVLAESEDTTPAVKAAESSAVKTAAFFTRKAMGYALIGLAILLLVGYTLWYFRDYAKEIYDKIRSRDDSTRF